MDFKNLINFSYSHSYFDNGQVPGLLTVRPLPDTQVLLANSSMSFKETAEGFFVYSATEQDGAGYFISPPEGSVLSFALYSNNPYLVNFTEMAYLNPGEEVFYSSYTDGRFTFKEPYPLQQKGLLVNTKSFYVEAVNSSQYGFKNQSETGGTGKAGFPSSSLNYLNMTDWPDGLYEVTYSNDGDSNEIDEFSGKKVFVSRKLIANPPLAILEIPLPDSIPDSPTEINLNLKSRSVYWRYQINSDVLDMSSLSINAKHASLINEPGTEGHFPIFCDENNKDASISSNDESNSAFISNNKVRLTQAPWIDIELIGAGGKALVKNLPNPNVEHIYPFQSDKTIGKKVSVKKGEFYALIQVEL